MPRLTSYAQHFLRSPRIVAELIGHSNIRKNDTVYDLGAGSGVISSVLARRCKQVFAVESEPNALKLLRENLGGNERVVIVEKDILSLPIPTGQYKIFANIPFNLSSAIVQKFLFSNNPPSAMYIIVQKQFAQKLVPSSNHFTNSLGAELAPFFDIRIRKPLQRHNFTPPPAVDTVLLEIKQRDQIHIDPTQTIKYRAWIQRCFKDISFFRRQPLSRANISSEQTPSRLEANDWIRLWNILVK